MVLVCGGVRLSSTTNPMIRAGVPMVTWLFHVTLEVSPVALSGSGNTELTAVVPIQMTLFSSVSTMLPEAKICLIVSFMLVTGLSTGPPTVWANTGAHFKAAATASATAERTKRDFGVFLVVTVLLPGESDRARR